MEFLNALYHGELCPENQIVEPRAFLEAQNKVYEHYEELEKALPQEYREDIKKLMDSVADLTTSAEEAAFTTGLRFAMKMISELLDITKLDASQVGLW